MAKNINIRENFKFVCLITVHALIHCISWYFCGFFYSIVMFQPILLCCVKNIVFKGQTLETFYNQGYHSKKTTARWVYFRNTQKKEISKYQKKTTRESEVLHNS